jgi:integrase
MIYEHQKLVRTACKPLTAAAIAALKPGQTLADGGIPTGAGRLKVRKRLNLSGSVVTEWLFIFWPANSEKRATMLLNGKSSRYSSKEQEGSLTIVQARDLARKLQADLKSGIDPVKQRLLDKAAAQKTQDENITKLNNSEAKTLKALLDAYVASLRAKGKFTSAYDVENMVKNHVELAFPLLSSKPAREVTAKNVAQILARLVGPDVAAKKGRTAIKLRSFMVAAFKLALGAEIDPMAPDTSMGFDLVFNPAAAVPPTQMAQQFQKVGQRTLSEDELQEYLVRIGSLPNEIHRLALELQILSGGQRFQQLLRLTESDVTSETLTLYDPKGKRAQPRRHLLPMLPELAVRVDLLRARSPVGPKNSTGSLFCSTAGSIINPETLSGIVSGISRDMIDSKKSKVAFRGGDIRRTCETLMAGTLGVPKDIRAQLLSHGLSGVQDAVYDKSTHLKAKTVALKAWISYLEKIKNGAQKTSSVTEFTAFKAA